MKTTYAVALLAAVFFAGCGSGGSTGDLTIGHQLSEAQWHAKAEAICRRSDAEAARLGREVEEIEAESDGGEEIGDLADVLDRLIATGRTQLRELRALGGPPGDPSALNEIVADFGTTLAASHVVLRAMRSFDVPLMREAMTTLEDRNEGFSRDAERLGLAACAGGGVPAVSL